VICDIYVSVINEHEKQTAMQHLKDVPAVLTYTKHFGMKNSKIIFSYRMLNFAAMGDTNSDERVRYYFNDRG
jgi:rRNA pseudouridine-1189 N-methylase Emg1 (Nep1/Mra1 family)